MQGNSPAEIADIRALVDRVIAAVEAKDVDAVVRCFAEDGVLIDPHYPTPRMVGKVEIADGLHWVFGVMQSLQFTVLRHFFSSDGQQAAVEVDTNHVLRSGKRLRFVQVFVIETRDGVLTRMQAYEPYGPGGLAGLALRLTHLWHRTAHRRRSWRQ